MNNYVTGNTIKSLREKKKYTQKDLADILSVSDKTISKWETNRGLPDITMLSPIAKAFDISIAELISGKYAENENKTANIKKGKFYVCPVCSNVIFSAGCLSVSCCGITLPALEAECCDTSHKVNIEPIENENYITVNHHMTKEHYISFIAEVTTDSVTIKKLYPQQDASKYFSKIGKADYYIYCNKHGLFKV